MFFRTGRPSYSQGFARSAGESKNPKFWKDLVSAIIPALGPTGFTVFDQSPYKNHASFNNMESTDWVAGPEGYRVATDSGNEYLTFSVPFHATLFTIVLWVLPLNAGSSYLTGNGNSRAVIKGFQSGQYNIFHNGYITGTAGDTVIPVTVDASQQIVFTCDGVRTQGYKNGVQIFDVVGDLDMGAGLATYALGARNDGISPAAEEIISSLIYNRHLTANEVAELYINPLAPFELADPPIVFKAPVAPGGIVTPYYYTNLLAGGM
jgi:hypothetical protein